MYIDSDNRPSILDDEATTARVARLADTDPESWAHGIEVVMSSLDARLDRGIERTVIKAEVEAEFAAHSEARIRGFVPILVERRVRSRLLMRSPQ